MRQAHISNPGTTMLDFDHASALAAKFADEDKDVIDPVLVAWYDRKSARMSPAIEGADLHSRWRDYGMSHGGELEVDVGDDYAFIYAEGSQFEPYEESTLRNIKDAQGNEYVCESELMKDPKKPTAEACTPIDEWTSKLT